MSLPVALTRLRITILQADRWHGRPLYEAIVERARKDGWHTSALKPTVAKIALEHLQTAAARALH